MSKKAPKKSVSVTTHCAMNRQTLPEKSGRKKKAAQLALSGCCEAPVWGCERCGCL